MSNRSDDAERIRIADDRRHSLRVARVAIIPAVITAFATIAAAAIGVLWKADTVGAKVNAQQGTTTGLVQNVKTGVNTLSSLTDPKQTLGEAFPHWASETKSSPPLPSPAATSPQPAPVTVLDAEAISTDPQVLKSCYGLGSLELKRLRVEHVSSGYEITMRLLNTATLPESLLVTGPIKLSDARISVDGQANIGGGPFYAGGATDQKQLAGLFGIGDMIEADHTGALSLEFRPGGQFLPGKYVTFGATLLHYTKASDGTFSRQNTSMTCQDIPVLSSPS